MNIDEPTQTGKSIETVVTLDTVRSALKLLNDTKQLGNHPLAQLKIVDVRRKSSKYSDNSLGRGAALNNLLSEGIDRLKPDEQEPNYTKLNWRPYGLLKERFGKGRRVKSVADTFGIDKRHCVRLTNTAIEKLMSGILEWEELPHTARVKPEYKAPFSVPVRPGYKLKGRDVLLEGIQNDILLGKKKSIALFGLPGVGKTAIAAELARQTGIPEFFDGGIFWAGLGESPNPRAILSKWALKLGYTQDEIAKYSKNRDLAEQIRDAIGPRKILVIIDDAWDITMTTPFRLDCDHCAYLMTTRQPGIAAEFAKDDHMRISELDKSHSIELFKSLVQVMDDENSLVEELITLVGGLPLAINLMGRFLRVESIEKQPRRIEDAIKRLKDTEKRLQLEMPLIYPDYHPILTEGASISLDAVIAVSVEALDEKTQQAMFSLSVFPPKPNSFSVSAAKGIAQISELEIDTLYDWGLLEVSGNDRYTIHKTIADYASLRLEDPQVYQRLVSFCRGFIRTQKDDYGKIDLEINNMEAGLSRALENQLDAQFLEIATNLYSYYIVRGLYDRAETNAHNVKNVAEKINDKAKLTTALIHLGRISINKADYENAENYLNKGMKLAKELGDKSLICDTTQSLGLLKDHSGDLSGAIEMYQESLSIASELNDHKRTIQLFSLLGAISIDLNELEDAKKYCQDGLDLSQKIQNQDFFSPLIMNLGIVVGYQGDPEMEKKCYLKALDIALETGYQEDLCFIYSNLGANANHRGLHDEAERYFRKVLKISEQIGSKERVCSALKNIGGTERRMRRFNDAENTLLASLELSQQIDHPRDICAALIELGILYTIRGNIKKAGSYISNGLEIAREINNVWHICEGLIWRGYLNLEHDEIDSGKKVFSEANELAQGEYQELVAESIFGLAKAAYKEGNNTDAMDHATESLHKFKEIQHYRWRVVGQWMRDHFPDIEI